MKWIKRISIWIIVSLSLQCLGLFYLDHYFLAPDSKLVTKKVVENKHTQSKNIDINIPTTATNVLISYDAKYLSYYENKGLKIVNCKDGKIKNIDAEDGSTISFSKWLPDRNRMLLVEEKSNDKSSNLITYSYDISKNKKVKIKELALVAAKSKIEDIQLSPLTGVTYLKVLNEGVGNSIYRIDRMADMTKVKTIPNSISNMAAIRHEDKLAYEGLVYNKIYATSLNGPIVIKGIDKLTLIGTDNEDNIYVGELENNLVNKVYYGKISANINNWKVIDLQNTSAKKNLFVSSNGKIYQNNSAKGIITEIDSGTQTSYKGKLLGLYTKGISSLANNKISFITFK
ncbi:hypothetical protein [Clostridium psychrophilum]|uniref:hypothetical protein n=1 Tax=Clostridium psychrophilum TaxID=132926 RepID=UPI001C0C6071|nr:hypothetical protein [Clostridium psychrophilum]MBU3182715.1 hypothetical protein [Clostridium psychrophilum]